MSKRLLLADDSITIQKVIQITFAHENYELIVTDNGDAAFARCRELVPDLVLADVYMPGKNGYELCAAIKAEPALRQIPVLLLAGSFEPFDEGKARASGADAWIEKPFESQALIDKVAMLLRDAPAAPAAAPPPASAPAAVPAPMAEDPFADISFGEPAAPAPAVAPPPVAVADDWSDLNQQLAAPPAPVEESGFVFSEPAPPPAPPVFEFTEAPLPPVAESPFAFEEPAPAGADFFEGAEEIMALGDDDILGAEDLEPAGDLPTLTPWSRDELPAAEEPFASFADTPRDPVPVAATPVAIVPGAETVEPPAAPVAPEPMAAPAPPAAAAVEQRVATLTEAELEQIVERAVGKVIEKLAGTVLERVAWEVVPDLAEALIKDEIRKIRDAAA